MGKEGSKEAAEKPEGTGRVWGHWEALTPHVPSRVETTWTPTTCSAAACAPAAASRATRCPPTAPAGSAGLWRSSPWKVSPPPPGHQLLQGQISGPRDPHVLMCKLLGNPGAGQGTGQHPPGGRVEGP